VDEPRPAQESAYLYQGRANVCQQDRWYMERSGTNR